MSDSKLDNGGTLKECILDFCNKNKEKLLDNTKTFKLTHDKSLPLGRYTDVTYYVEINNMSIPVWDSHFKTEKIESKIYSFKKRIGKIAKEWKDSNCL